MTPPGSYTNFILGRSGAVLEHRDDSAGVAQLQTLARLSATVHASTDSRRSDTAARLLLSGTSRAGDEIRQPAEPYTDAQIRQTLDAYLSLAHDGQRRAHYDAMRTSFVLVHRYLGSAEHRPEIPALLREFRQITRDYREHLAHNASLRPDERMRYLFAAAGVVRNMIGRAELNEESRNAAGTELAELRTLLGELYTAITEHYRQHLLAHPNGEAYTGVMREIQMRQALLEGHTDVARQRALELVQWLTAHPPPPEDEHDESSFRWDYMAARALTTDPDFAGLVRGLDAPSAPENTVALVNGVSWELVQAVCASIDQVNEDSEAAIVARYRPLATAVSVLTLTRPAASLAEVLAALRDPAQADAIRQELETAAHDSAEVNRVLTEARGDVSLSDFVTRARESAAHVETLRQGAARNVLAPIFDENRRLNRIDDLAQALGRHPGLLQSLGLSRESRNDTAALHRLATELFRRGALGVAAVEEYGNSHPDDSVRGIVSQLQAEENSQTRVNELLQEVLNYFQDGLNNRPDHELAAVHSVNSLISQTTTIAEGVSVSREVGAQARTLVNRIEGYDFRARRVFSHLGSGSSLMTLGAGILLAETLPAALIARAGTGGRLAAPVVGELVTAGRLTGWGSAFTGIGSGLAMSLIGTGLHSGERARLGLRTHFWRDFGESAVTNTLIFGATIPFSRAMTRGFLTPAAEEGAEIAQLSRMRRLGVHASTALFGGTAALGMGVVWGRVNSGHWSAPSFDAVAENYLSIVMYEGGAAAFRGFRARVGLRAELEGRPIFEPAESRYGLNRRFNRRLAGFLNAVFTNLGPARAARINQIATRIVEGLEVTAEGPNGGTARREGANPQLAPARDFIARQLAQRELSSPGTLDEMNDSFLRNHRARIRRVGGRFVLEFVENTEPQAAPRGYDADLVAALRQIHLDNAASTDPDYLPRFLPNNPYELVELRVDPETGRLVAINGHTLGECDNPVTIHASYDPRSRELRLPPLAGETIPQVLDLGPMLDAHTSSPVPLLWTAELGARVLSQRLPQAGRARVNISIGNLNRDHAVELLFNVDTGEILNNARLSGEGPSNILRLTARYSGENKTLTFPAPRGVEGEYVLDMETGRITHRLPEPTAESRSRGGTGGGRSTRRRSAGRREAAPAAESPAEPPAARPPEREASPIENITGRTIQNSHVGIITTPGAEGTGPVPITVYFGRRSGRILGVSSGHEPVTREPDHVIPDHLLHNGEVPSARRRISYHGELSADRQRIVLEVPAGDGQEAGTLTLDLRLGTARFEAHPPRPPEGGGEGSPPPTGGDSNPPPSTDGPPSPPAAPEGEASASTSRDPIAGDGVDDDAVTGRHSVLASDTTGPQAALSPNLDVHALLDSPEVLGLGESRAAIAPNAPGRSRESQHHAVIPGLGEVSAYTEVGASKQFPPRNGDAYGFRVAEDGALIAVVADGVGGTSLGDEASGRAVEVILDRAGNPLITLGQAFRDAHGAILSDLSTAIADTRAAQSAGDSDVVIPADSSTVATCLRILRSGDVNIATVGDTQVWIARPRGDGSYEVLAPYLPASTAGVQRLAETPGVTSTVGMNASDGAILSYLGGRMGERPPPIRSRLQGGLPMGIFDSELSLPAGDDPHQRVPFFAEPGDLFLLMSDGVHNLFSRGQMAETIRGLTGAEEVRRAVQAEVGERLDLYRARPRSTELRLGDLNQDTPVAERRAPIASGRFAGNFIDSGGRIYDAAVEGNLVGHVSPDNVVLLVVRYDPRTAPAGAEVGGS